MKRVSETLPRAPLKHVGALKRILTHGTRQQRDTGDSPAVEVGLTSAANSVHVARNWRVFLLKGRGSPLQTPRKVRTTRL